MSFDAPGSWSESCRAVAAGHAGTVACPNGGADLAPNGDGEAGARED